MPALRAAIRAYDARLILSTMETMNALVARSIAEERYRALLGWIFAASALLLAGIGVYGLLARGCSGRPCDSLITVDHRR